MCVPQGASCPRVDRHDLPRHGARLPAEILGLVRRQHVGGVEGGDEDPSVRRRRWGQHTPERPGQDLGRTAQRLEPVVLVAADGRVPELAARGRIHPHDDAALAGPDDDGAGRLGGGRGHRDDHGVHEVAVEEVVRVRLVVPDQPSRAGLEGDGRIRVEVGSWTAAPVGVLRRSDEGRRVRDADVEQPGPRGERRGVPRAPARVDRRVPPQGWRGHSVEAPQQLARALVDRVDEAAVTADIDPFDAHGHGRGDDVSPDHLWLNVDTVGRSAGQPRRPQVPPRALVQCEERRRCDPEYLSPPHGDALGTDGVHVRR